MATVSATHFFPDRASVEVCEAWFRPKAKKKDVLSNVEKYIASGVYVIGEPELQKGQELLVSKTRGNYYILDTNT